MQVLVTGASGFVGHHLKEALIGAGHIVTAVSRGSGTDITKWEDVSKLSAAEVVYHLAGLTAKEASPQRIYTVNWLGTLNLLEYSRIHRVRCMVFASSYVYGRPKYLPVDEAHPLLGEGAYARSKILAEGLCEGYGAEYDLSVIALRVFNAYGPRQQERGMLIPTILSQLRTGGEVILRDPAPRRDFVYVDDVVEAFLAASQDIAPGFSRYNVAAGRSVSVTELVREIQNAWGYAFPVRYTGEQRMNEIMDCPGSNSLIAERLGWMPRVPLQEGIRRTVAWWKSNTDDCRKGKGPWTGQVEKF